MPISRAEHVERCKREALALLPRNPRAALASLVASLPRHPEANHQDVFRLRVAGVLGRNGWVMRTASEVREFIETFH